MRKIIGWLGLIALLAAATVFASSEGFTVSIPSAVYGFQENHILVTAPEPGRLKITIRDKYSVYRVLEEDVPAGKSTVSWDGLGWNEERILRKNYTVQGALTGASPKEWKAESEFRIENGTQALLYALPSDATVYLEETGEWFLEFKALHTDYLVAAFFVEGSTDPAYTVRKQVKGGRINQLTFRALTGKQVIPAGSYHICVFCEQNPSYPKYFDLTVREGKRPTAKVTVTGRIMPERGESDEEIWDKMQLPATVVDIQPTSHQRVYARPDSGSETLGTLHGQTQSLEVLDIQGEWAKIHAWRHEDAAPVEGWVPLNRLKVVQPQAEYGLLVDKKTQTMTVYQWGKPIETLLVSTGRMEKGELYQETTAGSFVTEKHMADFSMEGKKYDSVIRYDGGNLLHQTPYAWSESGKKDLLAGEVFLGTKASHACIRVQAQPGEKNGINIYWLWTHLPYHTRIIVLDDPEEREKETILVTGNTPNLEAALSNDWKVRSEESAVDAAITVTFGGDAVLGGREAYYGDPEGLPAFLDQYGMSYPFRELQSYFAKDDLTVLNLECVLKETKEGEDKTKLWRFRGLPAYAQALLEGSVEGVNLANNHTIDYGTAGFLSTVDALEGKAFFCGNGNNPVVDVRGTRLGFGGCRETTYLADPGIIGRDIAEMKAKGADFIIYQCHWGSEYDACHNALQEAMARTCQREGADLVIGHHPHVVQGMDWIGDMPVVYSLGNLMFGGTIKLSTYDGLLVQASFYPDRKDNRVQLRLIPVLSSSRAGERINDYQPIPAKGTDALRILKRIQEDTPFLLTDRVTLGEY